VISEGNSEVAAGASVQRAASEELLTPMCLYQGAKGNLNEHLFCYKTAFERNKKSNSFRQKVDSTVRAQRSNCLHRPRFKYNNKIHELKYSKIITKHTWYQVPIPAGYNFCI